jgi:WD40 repeat protein
MTPPWPAAWPLLLVVLAGPVHAVAPPGVLRDAQGEPLPPGARLRLGAKRWRLWTGQVNIHPRLALSADRRLLAARGPGETTSLYFTATGRLYRRLRAAGHLLDPLAFSPDGRLLATLDERGTIQLWQVVTGRKVRDLEKPLGRGEVGDLELVSAAFLPGGTRLAVWDGRRWLGTWDVRTGKRLGRQRCPSVEGTPRFSPDGRYFCTCAAGRCLAYVDLKTGRWRRLPLGNRPIRWTWSADSRHLAIQAFDLEGPLLVEAASRRARQLPGEGPFLGRIAFSPDGRSVAVEEEDQVEVRDLATGKLRVKLDSSRKPGGLTTRLGGLFYRDDRHLLAIDPLGFVRVFDVRAGKELVDGPGHRLEVLDVALSADGRTLVSLGNDGSLRRWDTRTGRELGWLAVSGGVAAGSLSLSGDARLASLLEVGSHPHFDVVLIDLARRQEAWRVPGIGRAITSGQPYLFSPSTVLAGDCSAVLVLRDDPFVKAGAMRLDVLRSADGSLARALDRSVPGSYALSADARTVAVAREEEKFRGVDLIDVGTGKVWRRLAAGRESEMLRPVALSPDGRVAACANAEHVWVWEVASGGLIERADLPAGLLPYRLLIAPGGRVLVVGEWLEWQREVGAPAGWVVWDLDSRRIVRRTVLPSSWTAAALSANGRTLALGQADSSILVYDIPLPAARRTAPPSKEELPRLWADLASGDAARAWQARRMLAAGGRGTVALLAGPLEPATRRVAAKWLADLDADDYARREAATRKLAEALKRGDRGVEMALRDLLGRKPSLEAYRRAERLLRQHGGQAVKYSPEELRQVRAVAVLEGIGNDEAKALLKKLAGGAPALLTSESRAALARLPGR